MNNRIEIQGRPCPINLVVEFHSMALAHDDIIVNHNS